MLSDGGISEQEKDKLGLYFDKVNDARELLKGLLKKSNSDYESKELSKQISRLEEALKDSFCPATGGKHHWAECLNDPSLNPKGYVCPNCRKLYRW